MENETIDFSSASADDFVIGGSVQESVQEPVQEVVQESVQEPTQEPAQEPVQAPVEPVAPAEPAGYKFKDDYIKSVVEFYEKTGDITPYVEATKLDFKSMTDEEILRRNLKEQYNGLSDQAFERLYKQEVIDRYKIDADEYSDEDVSLGKELLSLEANKVREKFIQWQSEFTRTAQASVDDESQKIAEAWNQYVQTNPATNALLNDKRIVVNHGEGAFNFEVGDAKEIVEMSLDQNKFFSQFQDANGNVDLKKFYEIAAIAKNKELYDRSLINYGMSLGQKKLTQEIKNPSSIEPSGIPTEDSGDFMSGLINAFATRGMSK